MNKIILSGRLTKEPDVKYTQSGKCNTKFTLAVNRFRSQVQAEQTADFINIVAWDKLAETCGNYLAKGQKVLVEGRLQIRSYETNDGQKRWVSEVIISQMEFLEKKSDGQYNNLAEKTDMTGFGQELHDEEIPF